jgi:glycerol kinase
MILVIDVGTTGLRAAIVGADGTVDHVEYRPFAPQTPFPGLVEFDATAMAEAVLATARTALAEAGNPTVAGVGIASQRASTIVWDRATGTPIAPALGWQDLRTIGECLTAKAEHGLALAPNQSATKIQWLLAQAAEGRDPAELCFGTVDSWVAWTLSEGAVHATDHSNAGVTGLYSLDHGAWNERTCELLGIDPTMLPSIVDSSGVFGAATALQGAPALAAMIGDQQGSLVGQGCVEPGMAKITFGTGGMLDLCTGPSRPTAAERSPNGTFPIVAWTTGAGVVYGVEAIMLSAGTNVEWLVDDMGLVPNPAASHDVAAQVETTEGVVYVPALLGLGTPNWDYGARGMMLGLTRGTERAHVVRAVLEGVAQRGADLVDAAEADTGLAIPSLRVDGGMSANPTFVQALADATGKPVEVSSTIDATTLGAGFLAGAATGVWPDVATAAGSWTPARTVEPTGDGARERWAEAIRRAGGWIPELSALDF